MADLSDLRRQLERKAALAGQNTASDWESRLRRASPSASGNMRQRTTVRSRASATGVRMDAKVDTDYANIVRSGQRPHVIEPRSDTGVLRFRSRGALVFARRVNHPGTQGNTWWDDALRDAPDLLARNWRGVR